MLTLDKAPTSAVTLNYQTVDTGSASAGDDFEVVAGTVTFAAGQTVATVSVPIIGDTTYEGNETFQLLVSGSSLASSLTVTGTIRENDIQAGAQNDFTITATEISTNNTIAGNNNISLDVGSSGTKTVTIQSDGVTADGGFIISGASANITVTAGIQGDTITVIGNGNNTITAGTGTGNDTITIVGTGNNTINVGAGNDNVTGGSGNDTIVFASGALKGTLTLANTNPFVGDLVDGGGGTDTVTISGDDNVIGYDADGDGIFDTADGDVAGARLINVENIVLDGTTVTIAAQTLAELSSITGHPDSSELTIGGTGTVDFGSINLSGMKSLSVGAAVSVILTADQITAIGDISVAGGGKIQTDEAGAALLAAAGVTTGVSTDGGMVTIAQAMTSDLAAKAAYTYTINTTASEVYDQIQLGGVFADQLESTVVAGTRTDGAALSITGTATVAQMAAIAAEGYVLAAPVAVVDTAANIANSMDATGDADWLTADYVSSLTISTSATYAQASKIFHADGSLLSSVSDAAASTTDDLVFTKPTYTITDAAATLDAQKANSIVTSAASVTPNTAATVAQAGALRTAFGTKLTGYDLTGSAGDIDGTTSTIRNGATDITLTTEATVAQAKKITASTNSGDVSYSIEDSASNLFAAAASLLDGAEAVTLTAGQVLTLAQAAKLAPYFADDYAWTLSDTGANLTSAAALALYEQFTEITAAPSAAITLEQAKVLTDSLSGVDQTLDTYSISDTATEILAKVSRSTTVDAIGISTSAQSTSATSYETVLDAASDVTATGGITVANAALLLNNSIGNGNIGFSLNDTAANIAATQNVNPVGGDITLGALVDLASSITVSGTATAARAETLSSIDSANTNTTITYSVSDTFTGLAAVIEVSAGALASDAGNTALLAATSISGTGTATIAQAQEVVLLNTARAAANKSTTTYSISDSYASFNSSLSSDTVSASVTLLSGAATVHMTGTAANIKTYATASATDGLYAHVDTFGIEVTYADGNSDLDDDITSASAYYGTAKTITITDEDLSVANAAAAYDQVAAIATIGATAKTKMVFSDISGAKSTFVTSNASQLAAIAQATSVSVTDAVSVSEATAIDLKAAGTLKLEGGVSDTSAALAAATSALYSATKAGSAELTASDTATMAEFASMVTKSAAALLTKDDDLNVSVVDSISAVQGASTTTLDWLKTGVATVELAAGSEVALSIAQAKVLALSAVDGKVDDIKAAGGAAGASYQIVDTVQNVLSFIVGTSNGISDAAALTKTAGNAGTLLTESAKIVVSAGTSTITNGYLDELETLVDLAGFDTVNSVYNISGTAATLAGGTVDSAVTYASSVRVTDVANNTEARDIYGNNSAVTFAGGIETTDYTQFFTIDVDGVATYAGANAAERAVTAAIVAAAGSVIDLSGDELTVEQAQSIVSLLGNSASLNFNLVDTAEALAGAGTLLAMASLIEASDSATAAQFASIFAGATRVDANGESDVALTIDVADSGAAILALTAAQLTAAKAAGDVTLSVDEVVTMDQARLLETNIDNSLAIDVSDSAANVVAKIAAAVTNGFNPAASDTVTLTSTVTLAQAKTLDTYDGNIDTAADVYGSNAPITGGYIVQDTAANLLSASNVAGYSEARTVVVTDASNISKIEQIYTAWGANDDSTYADYADLVFSISDTQANIIEAFADGDLNSDVLGNAQSITVSGVGVIEVAQVDGAGDFYLTGTAASLSALPAALREVGYIVNDTVAMVAAGGAVFDSTDLQATVITDTAAALLAGDVTVISAADEVNVTTSVTATQYTSMLSSGFALNEVAEVTGTAAELASADLNGSGSVSVASVVVTDAAGITAAKVDLITAGGETTLAKVTFTFNDTETVVFGADDAFESGIEAKLEQASSVTITEALNVAQAGLVFAANESSTYDIEDTAANIDVLLEEDISDTEAAQIAAIKNAASVALSSDAGISVALAHALQSVEGFDGVYTLSDTAANLASASTSLLAGAVEVQVTDDATVAEAAILVALGNIEVDADDVAEVSIVDSAAAIADASATLLASVQEVGISVVGTNEVVNATQAAALISRLSDSSITWDSSADTYTVQDTFANLTLAANATGVGTDASATSVVATDAALTVTQATTLYALNANSTFDLTGSRTQLTAASSAVKAAAEDVTVTGSVTVSQADLLITAFSASDSITFDLVTDTYARIVANEDVLDAATTIDLTTVMSIAQAQTFLPDYGSKIVGGYDIEDLVTNLVNAALNNVFSAALLQGAANVTLTSGGDTMSVAAASVITSLNFEGDYNLSDDATVLAEASADLVNGATTATFVFDDSVDEVIDVSAYTSDVVLNVADGQASGDVVVMASASSLAGLTQSVDLGSSVAFTLAFGYLGAGGSFTADSTLAEAIRITYGSDTLVIDGAVNTQIEDTLLLTGTEDDEVLSLSTTAWTTGFGSLTGYIYGGAGDDTITGSANADTLVGGTGVDVIDGGAGTDTVDFSSAKLANGSALAASDTGITLVLNTSTNATVTVGSTDVGADTVKNVENIIGTGGKDTLTGDSAANVITGGAGADTINGAGGADTISFGSLLLSGTAGDAAANGGVSASVGVDAITFVVADDTFKLDETVFGNMGNGASIGGSGGVLAGSQFLIVADLSTVLTGLDTTGNGAIVFDDLGDDLYFIEGGASNSSTLSALVTAGTALKIADITVTGTLTASDFYIVPNGI